ncbi:MAG TPA: glycosyltransferase family 39 protein [Candidatus Sulfotelmatobacter sp.]|nr:glycosyltransferase family 39 protein [Candidatus Sulfotelmatobacter sp.]
MIAGPVAPRRPLLWIALAALPFFLLDLGRPALTDGEAMYAEVPREMRARGDWVTPHVNGTRHFDKPPLIYWAIGAAQALLGETELSARLWPALAAWATIPVVGAIGGALFGARSGWLGALAFAASLGPHLFGRQVMPDAMLCLWIALAILGYARGFLRGGEGRGPWPWVMYASLGLAVLTKGLLGVGLPAAIVGLHALLSGRLRAFRSWRALAGLALAAAVALPWHLAVARANPDFFGYYVIREHLLRFTGRRFPQDEVLPLPIFILLTLVWTFPWAGLVPQALGRAGRRLAAAGARKAEDLLPLLWIGIVIGLFAASRSRLEYYALPAMPAVALLVGRFWDEVLPPAGNPGGGAPRPASRRALVLALGATAALMAAAAAASLVVLGPWKDVVSRAVAAWWPESGWFGGPEQQAVLERIRIPTMVTLMGAAGLTLGALAAARRGRHGVACALLAGMMAPILALVHWGFLVVEPWQSSRPVAEIVQRMAGPDDPVVFQEPYEYMWVGGITFYARRMVFILKDPRFEGAPARRREPPERFLDRRQLEALWASGRRVVVVADERGGVEAALGRVRPAEVLGRAGGRVVFRPRDVGRPGS